MNSADSFSSQDPSSVSFEAAFARLEVILEQLNSGTITLDESLRLYEEADQLIALCTKRLDDAGRRIETLVKNRQGELALDSNGQPIVQEYTRLNDK